MEDKKISVIIPNYKNEQYLARCVNSYLDQDWDNKEIIVVQDSKSEEADKIMLQYKDNPDVKYYTIKHKGEGAARARNYGVSMADGDIYVVAGSDYVAYPGAFRTWMKAFEDNPGADFVYGGYDWTDRQYGRAASWKFDPFLLECFPYIDCGNPLKREIFLPFDENCKSLQDYDWWLRMVKAGAKGVFIPDFLYAAELPKEGGLSFDSGNNWLERVDYIKKNHNIPQRPICVTSAGAVEHGINIAKMLGNADFQFSPHVKPHRYKVMYLIGCYIGEKKDFNNLNVFIGCDKNCKKIVHWVGADIYWLRNLTFAELQKIIPELQENIDFHFVECEQMQKEMKSFGLETQIVPIAPPDSYSLLPLPEEFTVAIMKTNNGDFDKYCGNLMDEVMNAMPNVKFKVFGDAKCDRDLPNVQNCGYVDMQEFIPQCSAILRIVRHDGMMMAVNQFIMAGREAISNLKMPYVRYIDTHIDDKKWDKFLPGLNIWQYPATKTKIIDMINNIKDGKEGDEFIEAKDYYENLLDKTKYVSVIQKILKKGSK